MFKLIIPSILVVLLGLSSCEYEPIEIPLPDTVSFSVNVEPIFEEQGCVGCHKDNFSPVLTTGNAYNSLMANPAYVVESDPETSLIYTKPSPNGGHPKRYTNSQSELVLKWIQEGAKNN